ncbi:MAG: bifunctional hydroxymethylpyrimidine kinase/phosphomethylpyrimidine kinase [Prevotella sp.]|nr:bifunctional hydroxymethylpyrimidine kinase/phosphomethylpyrimidine kinase [Prevotella sp.]
MKQETHNNTILTITGSDPTGESGVQADIKVITSLGCTAVSAITTITLQNTLGIQEFYDLPADIVSGQIEAIVNDVEPTVVKIGLVRRREVAEAIIRVITHHQPRCVVYDPVVYSSRGDLLVGDDTLHLLRERLLPLCTTIIVDRRDTTAVLGSSISGNVVTIDHEANHGFANGFASALCVYLSQGFPTDEAISKARDYCSHRLTTVTALQGRGSQLYNDFIRLVAKDYSHNSDVAHYAGELNVSSAYLGQVCRRIAGRSTKSIIDDYLLEAIKRQLTTTTLTIQEIAIALGFSSQAHLSRFFSKATGLSPTAFRQSAPSNPSTPFTP